MKKLLFIFCLCTLIACGGDDNSDDPVMENTCPTEAKYALRVTIRNAADDSLLEGVSVNAMDQMFEEVLVSESAGVYVGLEERPGTYQLIITKENFQTIITSQASTEENTCGLITQSINFELAPM